MIKDLYDYLAKPDKTIGEHVEDLIFRANILRKLGYIKDIHIYNLLIQACKGHDLGKANKEFLKRILNPKLHFDETKMCIRDRNKDSPYEQSSSEKEKTVKEDEQTILVEEDGKKVPYVIKEVEPVVEGVVVVAQGGGLSLIHI